MVWFFYSRRSWHASTGMSWTQLISHLKIGDFRTSLLHFYLDLPQVGLWKIPSSGLSKLPDSGLSKIPYSGLWKIPYSISGWVIRNTLFWVMKNTLFYLRLGYEKYPILSQVGLWKIPYSIAGWVMKNTLFCCNNAEHSSCDPVNLAPPLRRWKEISLMAMRTTASSKGFCILRFDMLSTVAITLWTKISMCSCI